MESTAQTADQGDLVTFIAGWLGDQLKRDVGPDTHFATLGLDSLDAVRLTDAIAERMGVEELPVEIVMDHPSVSALATHLSTMKR